MECRRFLVSGRVQGVFFRASTRDTAKTCGLRGWARNLPDGSVEVLACGTESQLQQLHSWLQQGPPLAQVKGVTVETIDPQHAQVGMEFTIR